MSVASRVFAALADDVYVPHPEGWFNSSSGRTVEVEGQKYFVREHVSNPRNGYQGTIYQHEATGDLIVAHRGTDTDKGGVELRKDALDTDLQMVVDRENPQARDALALVARALAIAEEDGPAFGRTLEVTGTGHSLGGGLWQVCAHHYDLRGETFNAYGAVSLDRRIPEGGDRVINHVMATDVVSAASRHYGEVQVYATPEQVQRLQAMGYEPGSPLDLRHALGAATDLDAHLMHHFVDREVDGRRVPSVLAAGNDYPALVAGSHREIIERFRDDVYGMRAVITGVSRNGIELLGDLYRAQQGPVPAGEPWAEERRRAAAAVRPAPRALDDIDNGIQREPRPAPAQWPVLPDPVPGLNPEPAPAARPPFRPVVADPVALDAVRRGVHAIDAHLGRSPDERSERLTAALYAAAQRRGIDRIDGVVLGVQSTKAEAGEYVFAWRGRDGRVDDWVAVRTDEALRTPAAESLARAEASRLAQQRAGAAMQQEPASMRHA